MLPLRQIELCLEKMCSRWLWNVQGGPVVWQHMQGVVAFLITTFPQIYQGIFQ